MTPLTKGQFTERFVAHMLKHGGEKFADGSSIEAYARDTAPSYFECQYTEDPHEGPEECAEADMDEWE